MMSRRHQQQVSQHSLSAPGVTLSRIKKQIKEQELQFVLDESEINEGTAKVHRVRARGEQEETLVQRFPPQKTRNKPFTTVPALTEKQTERGKQPMLPLTSSANEAADTIEMQPLTTTDPNIAMTVEDLVLGKGTREYKHEKSHTEVTEDSIHTMSERLEGKKKQHQVQWSPPADMQQRATLIGNKNQQQLLECYEGELPPVQTKDKSVPLAITSEPLAQESKETEQLLGMKGKKSNKHWSITKTNTKTDTQYPEMDNDGKMILVREQWVLKTYNTIINTMVSEVDQHNDGFPVEYKSSCFKECIDCCCQPCSCLSFQTQSVHLTDSLRKARFLGFKGMGKALENVFPATPLGYMAKEVFVYFLFIFQVGHFLSTLIGYINKEDSKDERFLLGNLVISSISIMFTGFDFIYNILNQRCRAYQEVKKWWKNRQQSNEGYAEVDDDVKSKQEVEYDKDKCCQNTCKCCAKKFTKSVDVARIFLSELMFYPQLIMSIFQFSVQYIEKGDSAKNMPVTTWLQEMFGFLQVAVTVYIMRVFILMGTVWTLSKIRNKKMNGSVFHIWFVVYACFQMVLQVLMIIAIGVRFHREYREVPTKDRADYFISGQLMYMIVVGYLLPIMSTVMFFLVHHYWTQKFPMEFFNDILGILRKPGIKKTISSWQEGNDYESTIKKMMFYLNRDAFDKEYTEYEKERFIKKIFYPFGSPGHVVLCFVYIGLLLAFGLCFIIDLPSFSRGWLIFTLSSMALGTLINIYTITIAWVDFVILLVFIAASPCFSVWLCFDAFGCVQLKKKLRTSSKK